MLNYKKCTATITLIIFLISMVIPAPFVQAQSVPASPLGGLNLPQPGVMVTTSPAFNPPIIKGITIHPENPLKVDFIVDIGDDNLEDEDLKIESNKLIKYFLISLTVPEEKMWVNLSPYEKDRIIPDKLGNTEMGRDLLAQDYLLKQLTASLIYPEERLGSKFWKRVYKTAFEKYGTTDIPMNTFNKVWIVPEKAVVYVGGKTAFVLDHHLKVMLEEDYLALESNISHSEHGLGNVKKEDLVSISDASSEVIREILIPEIEKEVNSGKNFAQLRQIFNSVILATWYKNNLKESLLGQTYVDKDKTFGLELEDKNIRQNIYDRYIMAFEKGVYSYIKEDYDEVTQEVIPRKYFSGGVVTAVEVESRNSSEVSSQFSDTRRLRILPTNLQVRQRKSQSSSPVSRLRELGIENLLQQKIAMEAIESDPELLEKIKAAPLSARKVLNSMEDGHQRILSVGVSTAGDAELMFAALNPRRHITATTIDAHGLKAVEGKITQTEFSNQITLLNHDVRDKMEQYEDNSFDFVYARLVLHYLDKDGLRKALKELKRLLKPGGKLYVVTRSGDRSNENEDQEMMLISQHPVYGKETKYDPDTGLTQYYSPKKMLHFMTMICKMGNGLFMKDNFYRQNP